VVRVVRGSSLFGRVGLAQVALASRRQSSGVPHALPSALIATVRPDTYRLRKAWDSSYITVLLRNNYVGHRRGLRPNRRQQVSGRPQLLNSLISQLPDQKIKPAKAAKAATVFSGPVVILFARACPELVEREIWDGADGMLRSIVQLPDSAITRLLDASEISRQRLEIEKKKAGALARRKFGEGTPSESGRPTRGADFAGWETGHRLPSASAEASVPAPHDPPRSPASSRQRAVASSRGSRQLRPETLLGCTWDARAGGRDAGCRRPVQSPIPPSPAFPRLRSQGGNRLGCPRGHWP